MSIEQERRAAEVVLKARRGELGQDGVDLVALFREATERGTRESHRLERIEREANALAAVLADIMDGKDIDDVVDDLPHDARRRVIAYRHKSTLWAALQPQDQFGRLPDVPPRASVMRDRVRTVEQDHRVIEGELPG